METKRVPQVGEAVKYLDELRNWRDALITAPWSATCVNLVVVSADESKQDSYGRQVERETSQMHQSAQVDGEGFVVGRVWRFPDEPEAKVRHQPLAR